MKKERGYFIVFLLLFYSFSAYSQVYVRAVYPGGENYPDDRFSGFDKLFLSREQPPLVFRSDFLSGPAILVDGARLELEAEEINPYKFYAVKDNIRYSLFVRPNIAARSFIIEVEMRKNSQKESSPHDLSLILGFDIGNMNGIPPKQVYYPTILRKEENSMWGCFTTPENRLVAIACPNPVDKITYLRIDDKTQTVKIDLLAKENFRPLSYNESEKWAVSVAAVPSSDCLKNVIYTISKIATIDLKRTFYFRGESVNGYIHTKVPVTLTLSYPSGNTESFRMVMPEKQDDGKDSEKSLPPGIPFEFKEMNHPGVYLLSVTTPDGVTTSAGFTVFRDPEEIAVQEIQRALKTPAPKSADEVCYTDLLVLIAGEWFSEYAAISEERFRLIRQIFLQPQAERLNLNAITTPESGFFLLDLALLSKDPVLANLIAEYFSRMQLPNGSLFYPKTKEDITATTMLLSAFMKAIAMNRKTGNTEAAGIFSNVLIKAMNYLKNKELTYDESLPSRALMTAENFLYFSKTVGNDLPETERQEFFQAGAELLKSVECHIQKENASPYFHASYNTPFYAGVFFPTDPTAVFLNASMICYEITGREEYLLHSLNALATLINRSREFEHQTVHAGNRADQHCRFQATLLLMNFLLEKAYIYVESPQTVRGYHCFIKDSDEKNTIRVVITDAAVKKIHIRTQEPVRINFETPDGCFYKTVSESGWIDLRQD
ncbi:MAG: hypothetical protein SOZ27_08595 [Spirochaetia bacterium]|nr:hypothetical protein [Spirochaetia bacterium]